MRLIQINWQTVTVRRAASEGLDAFAISHCQKQRLSNQLRAALSQRPMRCDGCSRFLSIMKEICPAGIRRRLRFKWWSFVSRCWGESTVTSKLMPADIFPLMAVPFPTERDLHKHQKDKYLCFCSPTCGYFIFKCSGVLLVEYLLS